MSVVCHVQYDRCVPCAICPMCAMTHAYLIWNSFMCTTQSLYTLLACAYTTSLCAVTHSHIWFVCTNWLIHTYDHIMPPPPPGERVLLTWLMQSSTMTHSDVWYSYDLCDSNYSTQITHQMCHIHITCVDVSHSCHLCSSNNSNHIYHASIHRPTHSVLQCNALQHTATHCNTLQHTATHSNNSNHIYHASIHRPPWQYS